MTDRLYTLGTKFTYVESSEEGVSYPSASDNDLQPVETVWGGGGEEYISSVQSDAIFYFGKIYRENIRSSWSNGQMPLLYFI